MLWGERMKDERFAVKDEFFAPCVGFDFEEDGIVLLANQNQLLSKTRSLFPDHLLPHHWFWHVANRQPQRQAAEEDLGTDFVLNDADGFPAKVLFEFAPFAQLQQVRLG